MEKENIKDIEINFQEIFLAVFKRIWIPIIAAVVFYVAGFWYSANKITPLYTSQAELLVISNNAAYSSQSVMMDDNFTKNYIHLIKNNHTILGNVIEKNELDMTPSQLSSKISVSSPAETQIIMIRVTDPSPIAANAISNSLCVEAQKYITEELIKADNIRITNPGTLPTKPSSPDVGKNAVTAAVLAFLAACGVIAVIHLVNDSLVSVEDVEKRLGIKVIGKIPYSRKLGNKRSFASRKETEE